MTAHAITAHIAEAALFDNILSHEACLPAAFIPGPSPGRLSHAESLLRALALIEDMGREDNQNERDELPPFSQRIEAKLDLSMLLLGRVLEQANPPLPTRTMRWSLRGARVKHPEATGLCPGHEGILRFQPCDWLPESLDLPASILTLEAPHWLWLCFPAFAPSLNDALERHLFRQHRRHIAQSRTTADDQPATGQGNFRHLPHGRTH